RRRQRRRAPPQSRGSYGGTGWVWREATGCRIPGVRTMRYWIIQNRESKGPYTIAQLRSMWHSGAITGDTLYCAEGSNVWLTLEARAPELEQPRQARMQSADDDLLYQDATFRNYGGFWIRVGAYFVD